VGDNDRKAPIELVTFSLWCLLQTYWSKTSQQEKEATPPGDCSVILTAHIASAGVATDA
jgi:hypothetical protein